MDAVIFDVDGTLWDSAGMVTASWNKALAKYAPYPIHIEEEALKSMLGRPVTEFYDRFWGDLPQEEKVALGQHCLNEQVSFLLEHPAPFYPGVYQTFQELSAKLPLYIVSNCQLGYIDTCMEAGNLASFISGQLCFAETQLPKSGTILQLMREHDLKDVVYVGDTAGDAAACKEADIPFIWASYGYGNVEDAHLSIRSMSELPALLGL